MQEKNSLVIYSKFTPNFLFSAVGGYNQLPIIIIMQTVSATILLS